MAKFEQDLEELERVVEQLERGDLSLEESVDLFEKGVLLSRSCKSVLNRLEARVQALVEPERPGPIRVEDVAIAVAEGEGDEEEDESFEPADEDEDSGFGEEE